MVSLTGSGEHGFDPPLQPSDAVELTSATFPPAEPMLVGPVASAAGKAAPVVPPASCTRKYCPELRVALGSSVSRPLAPRIPVPFALVYCKDKPSSDAGVLP